MTRLYCFLDSLPIPTIKEEVWEETCITSYTAERIAAIFKTDPNKRNVRVDGINISFERCNTYYYIEVDDPFKFLQDYLEKTDETLMLRLLDGKLVFETTYD